MTHGDKKKANKKASKASGKKGRKAVASSKGAAQSSKAKKQTASKKTREGTKPSNNGKPRTRISPDSITFTNPVVANAFKRAVKKYPNAFRRLTD